MCQCGPYLIDGSAISVDSERTTDHDVTSARVNEEELWAWVVTNQVIGELALWTLRQSAHPNVSSLHYYTKIYNLFKSHFKGLKTKVQIRIDIGNTI